MSGYTSLSNACKDVRLQVPIKELFVQDSVHVLDQGHNPLFHGQKDILGRGHAVVRIGVDYQAHCLHDLARFPE